RPTLHKFHARRPRFTWKLNAPDAQERTCSLQEFSDVAQTSLRQILSLQANRPCPARAGGMACRSAVSLAPRGARRACNTGNHGRGADMRAALLARQCAASCRRLPAAACAAPSPSASITVTEVSMPDLIWLAVLAGLAALTLAFLRLTE
ncbi:hypothetical protein KXV85_005898, partial [Aspergillus fumigatus]